jgi:hypothetical protein
MFRAVLAHPQEVLHKHLVHCVRVMSVGCTRVEVELVSRHNNVHKSKELIREAGGGVLKIDRNRYIYIKF